MESLTCNLLGEERWLFHLDGGRVALGWDLEELRIVITLGEKIVRA